MKRFTVLVLHRQAGKTELAIMHLVDRAMSFEQELGLFFYICPLLKQAKSVAWSRLKQRCAPLIERGLVEVSESDLAVRFTHNGAVIRLYGADNPDAMRGVRLDGFVGDEVAQWKPEVWDEILSPTLVHRKGWALFIGTAKGVNLFSKLYFDAVRPENREEWHRALWTCYDTEAITPSEIARIKANSSETAFAREMLCDFSAAGADQLISISDVELAMSKTYKPGEVDYAPKIMGVDPARFGDDRSVIFKRQGLQAYQPLVFRGMDQMQLAGQVGALITTWYPDAVFIDSGMGAGVIDRLRQLGHEVVEVNFGGKPIDEQYANKRSEMWHLMAGWMKAGGALPDLTDLRQDLGAPTYWFDAANRRVLEAKDDLKKRGLPSPDLGDALALTFAHPVEKRLRVADVIYARDSLEHDPYQLVQRGGTRERAGGEYDPYANLR
jgi:hypothetical protein